MPNRALTVILTHENADFDAIASQLGAALLNPSAVPVLPRRCNRNVKSFVALYRDELPFVEAAELGRQKLEQIILVDTQGLVAIKGVAASTPVHILDHHPLVRDLPPGWTFSGDPIGATTTLLIEQMVADTAALTPVQATLLLLGIYEDTGSLSYITTTPRDARAAAWLMEQGANLQVVNDFLHHPLSEVQHKLYDRMLKVVHTYELSGHKVVVSAIEANTHAEEISTLAHRLRDTLEPAALFVLVAFDDSIQLVSRSTSDDIDVGAIAAHFGGGGHSRAAAALIRERELESVRLELLEILPRLIRPAVTVGAIMSRGAQTLTPDTPIREAAQRMARTGHEGYPVVQGEQVVGLLTRRAVDRGMQHGLGHQAVERVMNRGQVFVTPDDPVEKLEKLMIAHGWGQMPVMSDGQVVGIVTRTDLIKLWAEPPRPPRRAEIKALLEQALAPELAALVREIAAVARAMGYSTYFVGGLVRDLLLGFSIGDIDIVVEGDAIALAKRLARDRGGRIKSHARFGTAKWLFDGYSIDLVTARTEFYAHPSALPQVERSSIKQDLHRRDFTINTLAICLDPGSYGELFDFYGGEQDLKDGIIRVLHSLSFVEDPTRMLRAVRLEQRLGFHIEPRTHEQLLQSLDLLDRVSGDRIRHELDLILREARPEEVLRRLRQLRMLPQIYVGLTCDEWTRACFERLRDALSPEGDGWPEADDDWRILAGLAILCYRLDRTNLEAALGRLKVPRAEADILREVASLQAALPQLAHRQPASAVYHALLPYSLQSLFIVWVVADNKTVARRIRQYVDKLRHAQPILNGNDLRRQFGLAPGPRVGQILEALRDAILDGKVSTRQQEESLVKRWVDKQQTTNDE